MLVTTNLYLILTFASEIQRRVDFMYNNNDYGNILMIIYLSSLRHAHAGSRIINHLGQRPRFARCLQKGNLSKIKHMLC